MVQVLAGVTLPGVHQLGAGLVQLQLQRLNAFQVAHRIKIVWHIVVAHHHKRLTVCVRHRSRIYKKFGTRLWNHRHRVFFNVVEFEHNSSFFIHQEPFLFLTVRSTKDRVQQRIGTQIPACTRLVPLVLLRFFQRPYDALRNPLRIVNAGRFRINKDIEWRNPFNKRLILHHRHRSGRNVCRYLSVIRQLACHERIF